MQIACKRLLSAIFVENLESDQCRQALRIVGTWTSFRSVLMVDRFCRVVCLQQFIALLRSRWDKPRKLCLFDRTARGRFWNENDLCAKGLVILRVRFDTTVGSKCIAVDVLCIECTHSHRMHSIAHENVRGHFASVHEHKWKLWASVVHLYLWQRQRNLKGPEAGRSKIPLKKKYKVHVQNEMLWTFVTSAHATGCRPFLSNQKQFISSDVAGVLDSPACVSVKTTNWAVVLRAKLVYVDSACPRVIYSLAGFGQTCWHGLLEHSGVTRRLSHLRGATGQHSEKR